MPYEIQFARSALRQLDALSANERALLVEQIETHLSHEPLVNSRNRKPLRPNPLAPRELRVGYLRAFYDVENDRVRVVNILAIGKKSGDKLYIDDQEIEI